MFNGSQRLPWLALFCAILIFYSPLFAIDFETHDGEVRGSFDTTLSYGLAIRASNRDRDLIGRQNGGTANSVNGDNGNLNYSAGDIISNNLKVTHELQARYRNYTFFTRGLYFYDFEIMHGSTRRTDLSRSAQRYLGRDARLLDAYLSGNYEIGDSLLNVRLGNQVLSWGESTFIQNGINTINHVDVSRFRTAGAELRDGLMPLPMLNTTVSINENISAEAFYLFQWNNTEIEPEGTFFSTSDIISPGANTVLLGFGAPGIPDDPPVFGLNPPVGVAVPRMSDDKASNHGQFGLALRYFAPGLNDTEFALYYTKLHSRLPLISGRTGTLIGAGAGDYAASASYRRVFPEDIHTIGTGFNTEIPGTGLAVQGELLYRIDQPLQADDVELLYAALSPLNPAVFSQSQLGAFGFDEEIQGYIRRNLWQGQMTVSKVLGPNLGADQWILVGEVGGTYIVNMPDKDVLRLETPGTYTSGNPFFTAAGIQPETEPSSAFPDSFSWGVRMRARADFNNAIGAVNLKPQLAWSWDQGTTPAPITNFVDNRQSVTASLAADYLSAYQFEVAYTNFYNGGRYNLLKDRDFFSFTASYAF